MTTTDTIVSSAPLQPGSDSQTDTIRFLDSMQPALEDGTYTVTVAQKVEYPATDTDHPAGSETFPSTTIFSILGPRFTLPAVDVRGVFPPRDANGPFDGVLPHVSLSRATLPWERQAGSAGSNGSPWLALLLFTEDEWQHGVTATTCTVEDVCAKDPPTAVAFVKPASEPQQHKNDKLEVIDVEKALAKALLPRRTELALLCHVREATRDGQTADEAVVLCNRAIHGADGQPVALRYRAVLVSVEGRYGAEDELSIPGDRTDVRFVSLHSWSFSSQAEQPDLAQCFQDLCLGNGAAPRRAAPSGQPDSQRARFHAGYVPILHRMRDGSRNGAWYRGPLLPWDVPVDQLSGSLLPTRDPDSLLEFYPPVALPARTADELLEFDHELGMFDVSYAAAWELGRLLALRDREFSTRLYRWKRRHRHDLLLAEQEEHTGLVHHVRTLDHPDDDPDTLWLRAESLLARLGRLEGVPFRYLVADSQLLPLGFDPANPSATPPGSLRIFAVDPRWVECLLDGAFSVGRSLESDRERDSELWTDRLRMEPVPPRWGFLLRAPWVAAWPGLQCDARAGEASLEPVRLDRPAPDVLIGLFECAPAPKGAPAPTLSALTFHPAPETLHFGLDHVDQTWSRKLRNPNTGAYLDHSEKVVFRAGEADARVVDVEKYKDALGTALHNALPEFPNQELGSHTLALTLLDAPDRVTVNLGGTE